jgi:hypothetical protein
MIVEHTGGVTAEQPTCVANPAYQQQLAPIERVVKSLTVKSLVVKEDKSPNLDELEHFND